MFSISFTAGRNVDNVPMSEQRWADFNDLLNSLMATIAEDAILVEEHYGRGSWGGVSEESYKVTCIVEVMPSLEHVKHVLASLCREYSQDAIALTVGVSELIAPQA